MNKILLTLATCWFLIGCAPVKSTKVSDDQEENERIEMSTRRDYVVLKEKESIFLQEQKMNITFLEVLEDVRCPEGAQCGSYGNATIEVELMMIYSRPRVFKLSLGDLSGKEDMVSSIEFSGYSISLHKLKPHTTTQMTFDKLKGDYEIELKVSKIEEEIK